MTEGTTKALALCIFCKGEILLAQDANFIQGYGHLHRGCINSFLADEGGKGNRFKMLFIGPNVKTLQLWERIRASKDFVPDLEPNVTYKEGKEAVEAIKEDKYYDFVFLDAIRAENLLPEMKALKEKKENLRPRSIVFYGFYNPTELKCIEDWQREFGILGMDVKILKLHEVCFARLREKNITHEERGVIENELLS